MYPVLGYLEVVKRGRIEIRLLSWVEKLTLGQWDLEFGSDFSGRELKAIGLVDLVAGKF